MKRIFMALLILAGATSASASEKSCSGFLKAFSTWEDDVRGEIVIKHSFFDIVDWDPNSEYDGIVLTKVASKSLPKSILEVEYVSTGGDQRKISVSKELLPFEGDASLKQFETFKAKEFFELKKAGKYTVRLKNADKTVCEQTHKFSLGH